MSMAKSGDHGRLLFLAALAQNGANEKMLQQLVRETRQQRTAGGLEKLLPAAVMVENTDFGQLLQVVNLVDKKQFTEARSCALEAVRAWGSDWLEYNPLQLEVLKLLSEAVFETPIDLMLQTKDKVISTVLKTVLHHTQSALVHVNEEDGDVVSLRKAPRLGITRLFVQRDIPDNLQFTLIDMDIITDEFFVNRMTKEEEELYAMENALEILADEFEALPSVRLEDMFPRRGVTLKKSSSGAKKSRSRSRSSRGGEGHLLQAINDLQSNLQSELHDVQSNLQSNLQSLRSEVRADLRYVGVQLSALQVDISEQAEFFGRGLLLQVLRSKFPEFQITCGIGSEEFEYNSDTPAAVALEQLTKLCLKGDDGFKKLKARDVPEKAEIDCVCQFIVPSVSGFTPPYCYLGEVSRSKTLCNSASDYKHPTSPCLNKSSKLLFKLIQLERGILSVGNVIGCAITSPSFRKMSETDKTTLLSSVLSKAGALQHLDNLFKQGNLLLLPS